MNPDFWRHLVGVICVAALGWGLVILVAAWLFQNAWRIPSWVWQGMVLAALIFGAVWGLRT